MFFKCQCERGFSVFLYIRLFAHIATMHTSPTISHGPKVRSWDHMPKRYRAANACRDIDKPRVAFGKCFVNTPKRVSVKNERILRGMGKTAPTRKICAPVYIYIYIPKGGKGTHNLWGSKI